MITRTIRDIFTNDIDILVDEADGLRPCARVPPECPLEVRQRTSAIVRML